MTNGCAFICNPSGALNFHYNKPFPAPVSLILRLLPDQLITAPRFGMGNHGEKLNKHRILIPGIYTLDLRSQTNVFI